MFTQQSVDYKNEPLVSAKKRPFLDTREYCPSTAPGISTNSSIDMPTRRKITVEGVSTKDKLFDWRDSHKPQQSLIEKELTDRNRKLASLIFHTEKAIEDRKTNGSELAIY